MEITISILPMNLSLTHLSKIINNRAGTWNSVLSKINPLLFPTYCIWETLSFASPERFHPSSSLTESSFVQASKASGNGPQPTMTNVILDFPASLAATGAPVIQSAGGDFWERLCFFHKRRQTWLAWIDQRLETANSELSCETFVYEGKQRNKVIVEGARLVEEKMFSALFFI